MHLKRVIPCLDVEAGRVVKGVEFLDIRDAGDPVELAAHYDREGADELVFLDITATHERRETIVALARRTADEVFVPFTIGGGIRSVADAQAVLDAGADKVSVNSAALARPQLIDELARVFGAQCVVLAIDAKAHASGGRRARPCRPAAWRAGRERAWEAYVAGGRTSTGRDVLEWAREATARGAGEILLTSMDRDGTADGYDLPLTAAVSQAVGVPVIASGGAGELSHLADALHAGADAALCASIFHYGRHTIARGQGAPRARRHPRAAVMAGTSPSAAGLREQLQAQPGGEELEWRPRPRSPPLGPSWWGAPCAIYCLAGARASWMWWWRAAMAPSAAPPHSSLPYLPRAWVRTHR